jgi:hypothetical protein
VTVTKDHFAEEIVVEGTPFTKIWGSVKPVAVSVPDDEVR